MNSSWNSTFRLISVTQETHGEGEPFYNNRLLCWKINKKKQLYWYDEIKEFKLDTIPMSILNIHPDLRYPILLLRESIGLVNETASRWMAELGQSLS